MSQTLLNQLIDDQLTINSVENWLKCDNNECKNCMDMNKYGCSKGDFVLFFLNYIHDVPFLNDSGKTGRKSDSNESKNVIKKPVSVSVGNRQKSPQCITPQRPANFYNCNYTSPISPLYSENKSFSTPRGRKAAPSACLGDFLKKADSSPQPKPMRTRRITPTNLNKQKFASNENSYNFAIAEEIAEPAGDLRLANEMVLMREKMAGKSHVMTSWLEVTSREKLDILVDIYRILLLENLVRNPISEIYFLISLLVHSRAFKENEAIAHAHSMANGENSLYLAVNVLKRQLDVLENVLDKGNIRLLLENKGLQTFADFHKSLQRMCEKQLNEIKSNVDYGQSVDVAANVYFSLETDNRANFPTNASFCAFRKQRDLFYEILRIWESGHVQAEWSFASALGGKIRALLGAHAEPANFVHFARLFKGQLLMNACGNKEEMETLEELEFPSGICNIPANKLERLKSRCATKPLNNGLHSPAGFFGYEEFYKDFIVCAGHHFFYRHLMDTLTMEIVELDATKLSVGELDDVQKVQRKYVMCVKSLRVLAKFLGFVESLPYASSTCDVLPQDVAATQIHVRASLQPNFDLKRIVDNALTTKQLLLTIPWLVEYLSMLDYVALRTPHTLDVLHSLFRIYAHASLPGGNGALLLRISLGWLFELRNFPETLYFDYISRERTRTPATVTAHMRERSLDDLPVVDAQVFALCCPYLCELRHLLARNATANAIVNHITPITTCDTPSTKGTRRLQQQLEAAFFNGQPMSVRKTVEFVSERVASACVKQICNEIVPELKRTSLECLRSALNGLDLSAEEPNMHIATINNQTDAVAMDSFHNVKQTIDAQMPPVVRKRVEAAMDALLGFDVVAQARDVCVAVAVRTCLERIQQWVNCHVKADIFDKSLQTEKRKWLGDASEKIGTPSVRSMDELTVLNSIKDCCCALVERNQAAIDQKTIDNLLEAAINVRNHLLTDTLLQLLVDLMLLIIVHRPDVLTDGVVLHKVCRVWKGSSTTTLFSTVLCPRNILLMRFTLDEMATWRNFTIFLSCLFQANLLTSKDFERQRSAIYEQQWDTRTLENISHCLQTVRSSIHHLEDKVEVANQSVRFY